MPPFDRAAAAQRIATRFAEYHAYLDRYKARREREGTNQDAKAEQEVMKAAVPKFDDLAGDAQRVLDADPTDQAAFQAIDVLLRTHRVTPANIDQWEGSADQALHQRMAKLLVTYHLDNPRLNEPFVYLSDPQLKAEYWEKIYSKSPYRKVRGAAALRLLEAYIDWSNKLDVSAEQRSALRAKARRQAALIDGEYADDEYLKDSAAKRIKSLDNAVGATLPNFKVARLDGKQDELSNYRGRIVLVDFWATWCGWCKAAHPGMVEFKQEMADRPFEIIAVSVDEKVQDVQEYIKKQQMPWVNWHVGPKSKVVEDWGVRGYPTYLVVDVNGTVLERTHHFDTKSKQLIRKAVAQVERTKG